MVYRIYGTDGLRARKSYALADLYRHQCGVLYGKGSGKHKSIKIMSGGKVPTSNGWDYVSLIIVDNASSYYIANEYLAGKCDKFVPPTSIIHSKY